MVHFLLCSGQLLLLAAAVQSFVPQPLSLTAGGNGVEPKPLRIVPNFPSIEINKAVEGAKPREFGQYPSAQLQPDRSLEPILALAWDEFRHWGDLMIQRNVEGASYEFETEQWKNAFTKWWTRAIEADEQAKADLQVLYQRSKELEARTITWGIDQVVEEEDWSAIYIECSDGESEQANMVDCAMSGTWRYNSSNSVEFHRR